MDPHLILLTRLHMALPPQERFQGTGEGGRGGGILFLLGGVLNLPDRNWTWDKIWALSSCSKMSLPEKGHHFFSGHLCDINNGPVSGCSRKQVPMCLGKHFGKCWGSTPSTQWSPPGRARGYSCINCGGGKVSSLLKSSNPETFTKLSCNCQQTTDKVLKPVMDRAPASLPQALGGNTGTTRVLFK
uniref:Uncharacterized protein n=1 Tax=Myotis myotis TaxID=51298 RepID=A0A7J7VYR9_MYOMY|nr:hypothetical protein mMyoMyo1_012345 [Myotis myotis]